MRNPMILDVNPDPDALDWEQDWLQRQEVGVVRCRGPHKPGACPLLKGLPCGKITKADGILFQLDLDREDHRTILATYQERLDVPIRVVVSDEQRGKYAELLTRVEVVAPPIGPAALDGFTAEVESLV